MYNVSVTMTNAASMDLDQKLAIFDLEHRYFFYFEFLVHRSKHSSSETLGDRFSHGVGLLLIVVVSTLLCRGDSDDGFPA
jgi:hypothetical protein